MWPRGASTVFSSAEGPGSGKLFYHSAPGSFGWGVGYKNAGNEAHWLQEDAEEERGNFEKVLTELACNHLQCIRRNVRDPHKLQINRELEFWGFAPLYSL